MQLQDIKTSENWEVIAESKTMLFAYHNKEQYLLIKYLGGITPSNEYRETSLTALEGIRKYKPKLWLLDQREMNIHPKDVEWLFSEWRPKMVEIVGAGRKSAIIPAKNLFGEFATKQQNQKLSQEHDENELEVRFFSNPEEGLNWLLGTE